MRLLGWVGLFVVIALSVMGWLPSPAAAGESAIASPPPCTPLVKIFKDTICLEMLAPETPDYLESLTNLSEEDRQNAKTQLLSRNVRRLEDIIWRRALVEKFGMKAVLPSEEEVEAFRKEFNRAMEASYLSDKKTIALISERMKAYDFFTPDDEKKLLSIKDMAEKSVHLYEERKKHEETLPEEYKFVAEQAEKQVTFNMLTSWRSDKLLFEAYGGKLTLTPDGVKPIKAYEEFLKYIRAEGKMEIADAAYAHVFDEMEDYLKQSHAELPPDDPVTKNYFSSPGWQLTLSNSDSRYQDLEKWIAAAEKKKKKP